MLTDIDPYFCAGVLDELERLWAEGTGAEKNAVAAALTVVDDCAQSTRRLEPLATVHKSGDANRTIRFKVVPLVESFELILACPHQDLSFKVVYFGASLEHEQRCARLEGDLKRLWSE